MSDTIFMIHGMWGASWHWDNYKAFFEDKGYQCVASTLRFHDVEPQTAPHPELATTSLLDYADDLEKEIKALGVKPIIMGHSMGGLLAQILASRGLAKAVVLLSPAAPSGIFALTPSVIRSFLSIQMTWGFWRKPTLQTFNEAVYSMMHLLSNQEQKDAYSKLVYESGRVIFEIGHWLFDSTGASKVDEAKVDCPVLILVGSEDRITPASVVRKIAKKYQSVATYKEFSNHAHWVLAEPRWQEIAEYASDWLQQKSN